MANLLQHGIRFYHDIYLDGSFGIWKNSTNFIIEGVIHDYDADFIIETIPNSENGLHAIIRRNHFHQQTKSQEAKSLWPIDILKRSVRNVAPISGSVIGKVEILIWTDYAMYKSFKEHYPTSADIEHEMTKYVAVVINAADRRYKAGIRDKSLQLSLSLSGLIICKTRNCSSFLENINHEGKVEDDVGLNAFSSELVQQYNKLKLRFKYDHAMALTRLQMVHSNNPLNGLSNVNKICSIKDGKSSSLVDDHGGYSCVGTIVHELAHCLGCDHDGFYRSTRCSSADEYIMSVKSPLSRNGFYFSQCSVNSIKQNLMKPDASCIKDPPTVIDNFQKFTTNLPGQIYNTTQQCKDLFGTNFCLSIGTRLEDICYKMYCWDPRVVNTCVASFPAALGTSCGNQKWCIEGVCVFDDQAPIIG
ncbi:A disintegrin and metalloproteinase with thrombospondin motifs like [Patella vulgata]|uniref:A disintegrin and metalloproteinase with thrombospondin motifs like n=1 Tax=Patella vulgata TaxID=6465 RepID=UPI00218042EC|nr:A disintegrin and metalloproteinase with thrombospondin motifs like [Patella vulgata]